MSDAKHVHQRTAPPCQLVLENIHQQMFDHEMNRFGLRHGLHRHEDRAGRFLVQSAAVESDQRDRARSDLVGIADGMHQIAGESRSAVHGNQDQNIAGLQ